MKKSTLITLLSTLSCTSLIHAGGMGGAGSCASMPFVSFEAGYTWSKIDGFEVIVPGTTYELQKSQNQYTGRLAAGMISMVDDELGFTGEVGWGYYGRTTFSTPEGLSLAGIPFSINNRYTLTGFDALVGVAYIQNWYTLSFKVGALIQNMQQNTTTIANGLSNPDPVYYSFVNKNNTAAVLPELKLGAAYNIDQNWAITGSYTFAWGASTGTTIHHDNSSITAPAVFSVDHNTQNPMMNTLMLGVQYTFA